MQFQELVSRSGVSAARTKLYLREGLLAPGRLRNATRAEYDDRHVARLRMIDVLRGDGLSLAEIGPLPHATSLDVVSIERVGAEQVLLVWRSSSESGSTLRSSWWVRRGDSWVQRFHQGTPEG